MPPEIVPLGREHLERAASMVTARYRAAREQHTYLPARFEDPASIVPRLQGRVPGVAALGDGRLVGFIQSLLVMNRGERLAYVPDSGHAAEAADCYGIYRQMYVALADTWLANGCFLHGITLYPHERQAIDAWFSVGFGLAVVDAVQPLDAVQASGAGSGGSTLEVRRGGPEDVDRVTPLELALDRHLSAPGAYLPLLITGGRRGWEEWLADETHALWLAFLDGEPVGYLRLEPSEGLVLPTASETTVAITGAYTRKEARCQGIGTALLQRAFDWARSSGYRHCSVDYESANLLGSRFWSSSGFTPVCHSLWRRIDHRLAWANARRDEVDLRRAYEGQTWVG